MPKVRLLRDTQNITTVHSDIEPAQGYYVPLYTDTYSNALYMSLYVSKEMPDIRSDNRK